MSITQNKIIQNFLIEKNLNAVFIYDDLSNKEIKNKVLNETRELSGIYLILNKITLDYYIGSASTGRFHSRFVNHLFYLNGSKVIKNAVRKYNINSFAFIILELFEEKVTRENNKKLMDLEDFYLKSLLPNYNILLEAGSSFGYKHSEVTRLKMVTNYSEERRLAIGNLKFSLEFPSRKTKARNKTFTNETIEAMKQAVAGEAYYAALAKNRSAESRKLSIESINNLKKNSKAIIIYNVNGTVYGKFKSITEAAKSIGSSIKTIQRALKNKNSTPFYKRRFLAESVKHK